MTAKELYYELNILLSSPHSDTSEETVQSIDQLNSAIIYLKSPVETLKSKMVQYRKAMDDNNQWRPKLSSAINNRYWEKDYITPIPFRPFKRDR